ncbi:MAG: CoA-binding protein, partial [Anaerolineae bacterium]
MDSTLTPFFHPRGVAVIGASTNPQKLGYGVARNLISSGYRGRVYFVNPKGGVLFTRRIYRTIAEVPDPLDLAVLVVPAPVAPETLRACGERGVRAAILVSSGFREVGAEGAALEEKCLAVAREHGIRLIGPNCIGLLDTHLPLDTTFLAPPAPEKGDLAFISQSGALCAAIIDWSIRQGFGFSRLISLGNQADVNETDVLPHVAADEHTRVLTLYLESVSDGRRFVETARTITRHKPLIALKVGRSEAGQKAAASHTGALAGAETAYQAAFEKAGVLRAGTVEEMFDWARALAWCPLPKGRRMAVLTNAGGPGVIAADALEAEGLRLAELSTATLRALSELLPPAASLRNPVDMLASATASQYAHSLGLLLGDPGVDGVLVVLPPPPMYPAENAVEAMLPVIRKSEKPVVVALMGSTQIERAAEVLRAAHVPDYRFPERAASALARLAERAEFLDKAPAEAESPPEPDLRAARALLAGAPSGSLLDPEQSDRLMRACGIPTAPLRLTRNPEEAARVAEEMGFPVVLKVASPDIAHKSDIGGVLPGVETPEEAHRGYAQLLARARAARPEARLEGVLVQRMIPQGQEVILGVRRDPQFGPLVMFGSGGVEVEGLRDVAFALAPLTAREAQELIERTWAGRKL